MQLIIRSNQMNNKIMTILAGIAIVFMMSSASALEKDDIMGDPNDSLSEIAPQIKWVTGTFEGAFLIGALLGIFAGAIYYFAGMYGGSAEHKGTGIKGIIGVIFIVILVTIATTLIFTLYNKF